MPSNNAEKNKKNRANWIGLGLVAVLLAMVSLGGVLGKPSISAARGEPIGLAQFQQLWDRSDKPVTDNRANRSFTWGPTVTGLLTEPYTQGKTRRVQYFDKSRMELTEGRSVSNGLLAKELMTGLLQLGDADFKQYEADNLRNIVGDQLGNVPNPTYASLRKVATINADENKATAKTNQLVTATIDRSGKVGSDPTLAGRYSVKNVYFNSQLNHNVPDVFWNFMNGRGTVYRDGQFVEDAVFSWTDAIGLPLTEAYWTKAVVAGKTLDVLVQVFERRVLSYTPGNDDPYKVEMGNVGQHYYDWRTRVLTAKPPTATPKPPTPSPTTKPVSNLPDRPNWAGPVQLGPANTIPLWEAIIKVRPDNGVAYMIGHSGSTIIPGASDSQSIALTRSNDPTRLQDLNDTSRNGGQMPRLAVAPNGTAFVAWRHTPPDSGFKAYLRVMQPDGSLLPGVDIGGRYKATGGGEELDQPDIAYSSKTGKLYVTGQVQSGPPTWGVAETTDNGRTFKNFFTVAGNRPPGNIDPRICVDDNDNIHLAGLWGNNVVARSRYNGQWTNFTFLASENDEWAYRSSPRIGCGSDGYAYAVWQAPRSIGIARFTPGSGWQTVQADAIPDVAGRIASVTTSSDGRVWVAMGVQGGQYSGVVVMVSTNRGQSFATPQRIIGREPDAQSVGIDFDIKGKLHVVGNFKEPGPRQAFYTVTQ